MARTRKEKQEILKKLSEKISQAKSLVFIGYKGIKINEQEKLRKLLKKEKSELFITKKSLLNLVLSKFNFERLKDLKLEGEVGLVLGYGDEITPFKIAFDFSKENENLKIKGGVFEKKMINLETIKFLASLPSKAILQSQLLISLRQPLLGLINILEANLRKLINILKILSKSPTI